MSLLMSFVNPLEFILRYTVIIGSIVCVFGVALCLLSKRITMAVRNTDQINRSDRIYSTLMMIGLALILVGMIIIVLPIEGTFYKI